MENKNKNKKEPRGGRRAGAGRKKGSGSVTDESRKKNRTIVLTDAEWRLAKKAGGSKWIASKIEELRHSRGIAESVTYV